MEVWIGCNTFHDLSFDIFVEFCPVVIKCVYLIFVFLEPRPPHVFLSSIHRNLSLKILVILEESV